MPKLYLYVLGLVTLLLLVFIGLLTYHNVSRQKNLVKLQAENQILAGPALNTVPSPQFEPEKKAFDPANFNISDYRFIFQVYTANWYDKWAKHDQDFIDKFTKLGTADLSFDMEYDLQLSSLNQLKPHLYSPDRKYYLSVVYGGDPDTQVDLLDVAKGKAKQLLNCGTPCLFENGYWFDNDNFVVVATMEVFSKETANMKYYEVPYAPYIYHYNLAADTITTYRGISVTQWDFFDMAKDNMKVNVFFGRCHGVHSYEKIADRSAKVATEALKALFSGPYPDEGIETIFDSKTGGILKEVIIQDNIAYVNLREFRDVMPLRNECDIAGFFDQANRTLTQFPTIKDAVYFIEGGDYNFYHWVSAKCPDDLCKYNPFRFDYIKLANQAKEIYANAEMSDEIKYNFWYYGHNVSATKIGRDAYIMPYIFELSAYVSFDKSVVKSAYVVTRYMPGDLPVIYEMASRGSNIWYLPSSLHLVGSDQTYDIIFTLTNGKKYLKSFELTDGF